MPFSDFSCVGLLSVSVCCSVQIFVPRALAGGGGGAGGEERRRWEGERKAERFLFFDKSHTAWLLFLIIAIFTGIPSRSRCGAERFYQYSNFVLSSKLLFSSIRAADWLEQTFSECIDIFPVI